MRLVILSLILAVAAASGHTYSCTSCSCEGFCTNPFSYWKSHNAYSWFSFLRRAWPTHGGVMEALSHTHSEDRTLCSVKWLEVLKLEVGKENQGALGRPQIALARQWIAAQLNVWAGACSTNRLDQLIDMAGDLLREWCGTPVLSSGQVGESMLQLAATLGQYNHGLIGPGPCGCGDGMIQDREECDQGPSNGAPGSCCSDKCFLVTVGTECRASSGPCDMAEYCTGDDPACPPDGYHSTETQCRPAQGACDRPEHCTGLGALCPHDGLRREGWVCRAADGLCDHAEVCDGVGTECPPDEIWEAEHVCRPVAGLCDRVEVCDGESRLCPEDRLIARDTPCRGEDLVADPCDCIDVCDGLSGVCPTHEPLTDFEYAVEVDTVSDTFDAGSSGSSGTLSWNDSSWILYQRGAGQEVSIEDGHLNVTYLSADGVSARRALPQSPDPLRLASLVLKGKVVLSRASAPVVVTIAVAPKACNKIGLEDVAWCGLVRSATKEHQTTKPLVTPSGREVPCDALNLARRLLFHVDVEAKPFRTAAASSGGCLAIWTGVSEPGVGIRPTTLLFNDLTLEMHTEAQMKSSRACGAILVPGPGQTVAQASCPRDCPGGSGCLV